MTRRCTCAPAAFIRSSRIWARPGSGGPGLPFVFAVWAARRDVDRGDALKLHQRLLQSRAWGVGAPRPHRRRSGGAHRHSARHLSRLPRRPRLPAVLPSPGGTDRVLRATGHGRAGAGWVAHLPHGGLMDTVDRSSAEFRDYLDLYDNAPLLELGALAEREAVPAASRRSRDVHHRPQHQLHERVRRRLRVLRLLPAAEGPIGVRAVVRADRRQDRRMQGARRRPDPAAGRPQSVHPVRLVSRADALHQAASSDSHPRLLAVRGRLLSVAIQAPGRRSGAPAARSRARLDPRRRRRNPGRRDPRTRGEEEGADRGVARRAGGSAPPGDEDVGDDDVRAGREPRRPDRAPLPGARAAGAHRRVHGVHLLAAAAGRHARA